MPYRTRPWLRIAVLAALSAAAPARAAGVLDHLLCERMKDPLKIKTAVDMVAEIQPEFTARGCVLVKPVEFCVPATKTNVQPPPPLPNIAGQPLKDDYICYLVKCPTQPLPPAKQVIDQFGARKQDRYKPYKVCVPARKRAVPCGPTGAHTCGGACPNSAQVCTKTPTDTCECLPQLPPDCGIDPATGVCGGNCPAGETCVFTAGTTNPCHCEPPPPPPCGNDPLTGVCGGTCPNATDVCTQPAGAVCGCYPPPPTCKMDAAGTCGGTCPAGSSCRLSPTGQTCDCFPDPAPCGIDTAGVCGGTCPNQNEVCTQPPGAVCGCYQQPPTCALDAAGVCGGTCPNGFVCLQPLGAATCDCFPNTLPCGGSQPPVCGGTCPAPLRCAADAVGCNCH